MNKITVREDKAELIFKVFYLLHVLLAFNCFTFRLRVLDVTSIILTGIGGGLLIRKVIRNKFRFSYKFLWILLLFLASYIVSSIVNWRYGYIGNFKSIIWMIFQFFILYGIDLEEKKVKKESHIFLCVLIAYTSMCSFAGTVMTAINYGGRKNFLDGSGTFYGFIWGRLWGCYTDPNHGAIITAIAILGAIYMLKIVEKRWCKILLVSTIALNYLYMVFSDSRSAKLSLTLACFVWMCIQCKEKKKVGKFKSVKQILMVCLCTALLYSSFGITKNAYNYIVQLEYKISDGDKADKVSPTVGREEDIEEDYSNRRFDIWKSGMDIVQENIVFGVTFRNILPYAQQEMKDTYIVNNDYGKYDSFHNVVIDVLVSQGMIGICLFFIFVLAVVVYVCKKVFIMGKITNLQVQFLLVAVLMIAVDAMFISAVFFVNSPETIAFWAFLGYLIYYLNIEEKKNV